MNPSETPRIQPERLRQRRIELRLSQEEVSELAGMNQSTVSQLERGEQVPTVKSLVSLAQVLGTSMEWLLGLADTIQPITINSEDLDEVEREAVALLRKSGITHRSELVNILRAIILLTNQKE